MWTVTVTEKKYAIKLQLLKNMLIIKRVESKHLLP